MADKLDCPRGFYFSQTARRKKRDMSVDLWTKMALTIIAVSLAAIAWKLPFTDIGHAQTGTCGSTSSAPWIELTDYAFQIA
jgi:hypothetical protein